MSFQFKAGLALTALAVLCLTHPAQAQSVITFGTPTTFAGNPGNGTFPLDAEAALGAIQTAFGSGTLIVGGQEYANNSSLDVTTSNGTIHFTNNFASVAGGGTFVGADGGNHPSANANFETLTDSAEYEASPGAPNVITLNNLTAGTNYAVEIFALDGRDITNDPVYNRQVSFQDTAGGNASSPYREGDFEYLIGKFTATGTTETFQENFLGGAGTEKGGNVNAIVLASDSPSPAPEPSECATLGLVLLGLGGLALRARKSKAGQLAA